MSSLIKAFYGFPDPRVKTLGYTLRCQANNLPELAGRWWMGGLHPTPYPLLPKFPGVHSGGVPPVPIPNTAVKTARADNTRGTSPRKDRSTPGLILSPLPVFGRRARNFGFWIGR